MPRPQRVHYLRHNKRETSPSRLLVFDTESRYVQDGKVETHTLAVWCAKLIVRNGEAYGRGEDADHAGTTADALAALVERAARGRRTLWVFAHNLNFDLAVTSLPVRLAARGWELTQNALATDAPWCRMRLGRHRVTIADSASWLPRSVAELGVAVGIRKPALPPQDDDQAVLDRCRADVEITSAALCELMDWWDDERLGNWSVTGPSTGWSAMRHMPAPQRVVIDPDPDARAFERSALMGGRREAFRVGHFEGAAYADLDLVHAHLSVCAEYALPYRRLSRFASLGLDSAWLDSPSLDVLAECVVRPQAPRYPLRTPRGVFYPVGEFQTVLAGPELREARARGELRSIGAGYVYQVIHHMRPWALWAARILDGEVRGVPAVARIAVKGWSRTVPGRWAARTSEEVMRLPDLRDGWAVEHGTLEPGHRPAAFVTFGGEQRVYARDQESDDSFPAVLAFVQSHTRVLLGRVLDALGTAALQCNTDGVVARTAWRGAIVERVQDAAAPLRVAVKARARSVDVYGPQQVVFGTEPRLSGVPRTATAMGDLRFRYWSWPRLRTQIERGRPDVYERRELETDLSAVPVNRWRMADGECRPVVARSAAVPAGTILAPPTDWIVTGALDRSKPQHPQLETVLPEGWRGSEVTPWNTQVALGAQLCGTPPSTASGASIHAVSHPLTGTHTGAHVKQSRRLP